MNTLAAENTQQQSGRDDPDYQQGITYFSRARDEGFKDKELLEQAIECFSMAIRRNRKNPEPLVAMAYLMVLLEDYERARRYVHTAMIAEPNHPMAGLLLKGIKEHSQMTHQSNSEFHLKALLSARHRPESEDEFDILYDEVERLLPQQVQAQMKKAPAPNPVVKSEALEKLEARFKELIQLCQLLSEQLDILEEEFDIQDIFQMFRPLLLLRDRYQQAIKTSKRLSLLDQNIGQCELLASACFRQLNAGEEVEPQSLDELYDLCDLVADELDDLSSQMMNVGVLIKHYEKMIDYVQCLHERLDG